MDKIRQKLEKIHWLTIADEMHNKGYAVVSQFFNTEECQHLIEKFDAPDGYRKTVVMERHRFGLGLYKYWDYPLPSIVESLREQLYPKLAPIANAWMKALRLDERFPDTFEELQAICHRNGQCKPISLILRYGEGGYNTLHQDLYGERYFPIQAACFLNQPNEDYTGGEFVLTEQVPRAQSKAMVLKPGRGDMIIFTTNFRPMQGERGYYRANMRRGVSEVHSGQRNTLGIIFHDAVS